MKATKLIKASIIVTICLFLVGYAYLFFQRGIEFEGYFLKKHESRITTIFQGNKALPEIAVNSFGDIDYIMLSGKIITYNFEFNGTHIVVYNNDKIIFNGVFDSKKDIATDDDGTVYTKDSTSDKTKVELLHVIKTAYGTNQEYRGNVIYFIPALVVGILLLLNFIFPEHFMIRKLRKFQNPIRILMGAVILIFLVISLYI